MRVGLRMTEEQHRQLWDHLHPGDGREAAAWILCGRRRDNDRSILCGRRIFTIPHEDTSRDAHSVTWKTDSLAPLFNEAAGMEWPAIVHVHSHPDGLRFFSDVDDKCDRRLHADLAKVYEDGLPTASLIMLPDGEVFGRWFEGDNQADLDSVLVVGGRLERYSASGDVEPRHFDASHRHAFGDGTTFALSQMRIAVVGCSGTGSVVIELLSRLGVRELILIDPDGVEERNLNRIVNARYNHAQDGESKVHALANSVKENLGPLAPQIIPRVGTVAEHWGITATADIVFGCTDSAEGRLHLDLLCHHYCLPYIDVGVDIASDGESGISYAGAAVHYLRPGGDSLLARRGYRMETVRAEALQRTNLEAYDDEVRRGYIRGLVVHRPAVISLNAQAASMAVNEFLARLHGYRSGEPSDHMARVHNFVEEFHLSNSGVAKCETMSKYCGIGDRKSPLGLTGLRS